MKTVGNTIYLNGLSVFTALIISNLCSKTFKQGSTFSVNLHNLISIFTTTFKLPNSGA